MLTSAEVDRAAVMLTAVETLVARMHAAGVPHPMAVIRTVLELPSLKDAVEVPVLVAPYEDPGALAWAPEVRALLISYTVDDVLVRRVVDRCLNTLELFQ
jgi:hypothetical protein